MTPFLSSMTDAGIDLVRRLRDTPTKEQLAELMTKYRVFADAALLGHGGLTDADLFAVGAAIARWLPCKPRERARRWDAAALTALRAGAHQEALAAFQEAEEHARSKARQQRIRLLRELVAHAAATDPREETKKKSEWGDQSSPLSPLLLPDAR